MDKGFFHLKTASDLLEKLEWEYKNLTAHPGNAWHAFNFFVTAEHMADWKGDRSVRKNEPLLAICSHIANGGKHFELTPGRHNSVASARYDGVFEPGVFEEGVYEESLVIELEPTAEKALKTKTIDAISLASRVLEYWKKHA